MASDADEIKRLREKVAELERATQRLAVRDAAVRAISGYSSLAQAGPETLRAVCEALGWQVGVLWVVEPLAGILRCVDVWHAASRTFPEFEAASRRSTFSRDAGLPGRVWTARQPVWIPCIAAESNFPRMPIAASEGLVAALGFPILVAGEVVAVMEFFSPDIRQPDEELLEMLSALGNHIGQLVERRRAQESLDRFFTLSIDMLCIAGYDGYYKRLNPAWEQTLGYSVEELMAAPYLDFVHPDDREATIAEMQKLAEGELIISFENRYRAKDGTYRWMLWTAAPFPRRQLIYASARDITERKLDEEDIRVLKAEADSANRAKTDFLTQMSHEIRTPLNVVIGMGDLLDRTQLTIEQRKYVRVFQRAGSNLLALINDILDLAKVESGHTVLEAIDFEIKEVMESIVEVMGFRAREKGLAISCRILGGTPPALVGDPDRLRQVLINLVNNAVRFTTQGHVTLDVGPDADGTLHFTVSDTGIGIAAENLESIFEAFRQADASTARKYGGTGLGLAISKRLVELMGGRIWVVSKLDAGTTVHFTARFAVSSAGVSSSPGEKRPEAHEPAIARPVSGLRILVADDSGENRFLVAEYLKDLDCRLDFAEDGLATVEKFQSGEFDLVLMDLQMPLMDGYEATRRIRQWENEHRRPPVPVIALTASALENELQKALDAGCSAWLRKPVRLVTLLDTVGKFAGRVDSHAGSDAGPDAKKILVRADPRIKAVIPDYLDSRRRDVHSILSSLECADYETIRELGHKMSGTGGGYGFTRISEIGAAIERAARGQQTAEIRALAGELAKFLDQLEVV
jgi:PAS domain S-box-containing protein